MTCPARLLGIFCGFALLTPAAQGQTQRLSPVTGSPVSAPVALPQTTTENPSGEALPNIETLMHEVESHQRSQEALGKDYLYRQTVQFDAVDGHGKVKHTTTYESDVFYVGGVMVQKTVKKNGKELSDTEKKKQDEKIDKEVKKAQEKKAKAESEGKETDSNGGDVITVSRILELGSFTKERRVSLNGRDTIVLDYAGDPKAKTRNRSEEIIRDLIGTVWIDEQDKVLSQAAGRIIKDFKIGGGLIFDIKKDTSFEAHWAKINGEVWLPSVTDAQGKVRALLFFSFDGKAHIVDSDYRKFKATATILPGVNKVEEKPK